MSTKIYFEREHRNYATETTRSSTSAIATLFKHYLSCSTLFKSYMVVLAVEC
ncbi:MAG: hypothetical protein RMY64_03185 [Nostoc sp. DedQUE08]|uniref:hypothetical protein n=1 Tax=unclassified Nostoc TaxID=2593658 RepID=UPI002AD3369D|nr:MULTISPECIES: hypothetical protein [unclassified Nostoc]MDZ8031205.1 hypothetical protein [Nostoc sp. DedSLP04]MDZ8064632.1 hypothetical protein [Nostoc sp. DedQUE08]